MSFHGLEQGAICNRSRLDASPQRHALDARSMISWMHIIDIGHTAIMIPLAGAIAAWLLATKGWRQALWWCAIFAAGLSLVAMSKIAYLGWGTEIRGLGFKALSGHAWRSSAVLPVLFFVLMHESPRTWRAGGVLLGVALSLGLSALLVVFKFHTIAEVVASCILGFSAAMAFIRVSMAAVPLRLRLSLWAAPVSLVTFAVIWGMKPSSITPRLVDVALYFSGRDYPYRWSRDHDHLPRSFGPMQDSKECMGRRLY